MAAQNSYLSDPRIQTVNSTTLLGHTLDSPKSLLQGRSSSPPSRNEQADEVDSSRSYDFCVRDRTLFTITTIPAPQQRGYYHVVSNVQHDITEILKYDRIIRINDNDVKDYDATTFQNAFQTELNNSINCCKRCIRITLTLWRWRTSDIQEVRIRLSFESQNHTVSAPPPSRPIRKHGKLKLKETNVRKKIKVESGNPGTYVRFQPETETLTCAPIEQGKTQYYIFSFTFYFCRMKWSKDFVERVVCTMICRADDQVYDVVADLDTKEFILRPQQPISAANPDERFFILYELDTSYNVFEMLLYENQCVKYERTEKTFHIGELGMSKSKSKRSFIEPTPSFLFDMPPLSERGVHSLKRGLCCVRPHIEYLDGVQPCNEFMLEDDKETVI